MDVVAGNPDRGDQVDDDLMAHQGLTSPIQADVRKQAMFDRVPLARAWREVAHPEGQGKFIGESLQLPLPQAHPLSMRARKSVGGCGYLEHRAILAELHLSGDTA